MKKLAVIAFILMYSTNVFALKPSTVEEIWIGLSHITVRDNDNQHWFIKQDCDIKIQPNSQVSVSTHRRVIRSGTPLVIRVDSFRSKMCRVTAVYQVNTRVAAR